MMGIEKKSAYPPLKHDSNIITDAADKAKVFNDYFLQQTSLDDTSANLPEDYDQVFTSLNSITITEQDILDLLQGINIKKATGPYGISPCMLKEAGVGICPSLTKLFNLSLQICTVPKLWKQAHVIPIHKKNERDVVQNYRPVSILSCVGKLQEREIFKVDKK